MSGVRCAALALALFPATVAAAPPAASAAAALATACEGRDGWSDPAPPARLFGTTYYVGTCGITVLLVTGPKDHVLIDSGPADAAPLVLANIRALGFDPRDVKLIVGSHEHADHMGGMAALRAATGARLLVRAPAHAVLTSGWPDDADPQAGTIPTMAPVAVDGFLIDRHVVELGPIALTVVATPGHTEGGTSWTWRQCEGTVCRHFAYVDSLTAVAPDSYRFADHPGRVAPFRPTLARVARLSCDILITPHPGASDLFERMRGAKPLVDTHACARLADDMRQRLDTRLAKERR